MLCEMPVLNLPTEFTSSNDTRRDGLAVSTLRTDNAVANLYIGFVLDNLPTFRNISKTRPDISFTLGQLEVSFEHAENKPVEFDPSVSRYLTIKVCTTSELITFAKQVMFLRQFAGLFAGLSVSSVAQKVVTEFSRTFWKEREKFDCCL